MLLLYAFLNEDRTQQLQTFAESLPISIQQQINSYKNEVDRQQRILSKYLLAKAIEDFYPNDKSIWDSFTKERNGQNAFTQFDIDFSVSYAKKLVVVSASPNIKNGVDAELVRPIEAPLYEHYLSENEKKHLEKSTQKNDDFLDIWTKKEAVLKAAELRISEMDLSKIDTLENPIKLNNQLYYLQNIQLHSLYRCSLASTQLVKPSIRRIHIG